MKQRKIFSKEFKARVALDAIKGQITINELSTEYGVHPNQIGQWKKMLIKESAELFARGKDRDASDIKTEEKAKRQKPAGSSRTSLPAIWTKWSEAPRWKRP